MGGCFSSNGKYPADVPLTQLGRPESGGVEILQPSNAGAVRQAVDVCARSFAGTATAAPPREFQWLLADMSGPATGDPQACAHLLSAPLGFCVHFGFVLGGRGLVLVARSEAEGGEGRIVGCLVLYFYPKGWSKSLDGRMAELNAAMKAGGSKWDKAQKALVNGKRMTALGAATTKMKESAYGPGVAGTAASKHIHIQVVAVDPECQGQGVGRKLLTAVTAIGDALDLPLYLECDSGKNEAVYTKFGFKECARAELAPPGGGVPMEGAMLGMRRDVGGK